MGVCVSAVMRVSVLTALRQAQCERSLSRGIKTDQLTEDTQLPVNKHEEIVVRTIQPPALRAQLKEHPDGLDSND